VGCATSPMAPFPSVPKEPKRACNNFWPVCSKGHLWPKSAKFRPFGERQRLNLNNFLSVGEHYVRGKIDPRASAYRLGRCHRQFLRLCHALFCYSAVCYCLFAKCHARSELVCASESGHGWHR